MNQLKMRTNSQRHLRGLFSPTLYDLQPNCFPLLIDSYLTSPIVTNFHSLTNFCFWLTKVVTNIKSP